MEKLRQEEQLSWGIQRQCTDFLSWLKWKEERRGGGGEGEGGRTAEQPEKKRWKSTSCHTTLVQPVCVEECQNLYTAIFPRRNWKEGEAYTGQGVTHTGTRGRLHTSRMSFLRFYCSLWTQKLLSPALSSQSPFNFLRGHRSSKRLLKNQDLLWAPKTSMGNSDLDTQPWSGLEREIAEEQFPGNQLSVE